jgi:hypothetical protein
MQQLVMVLARLRSCGAAAMALQQQPSVARVHC